jgi:hypothetical protein
LISYNGAQGGAMSKIKVGCRISHDAYGKGTVLAIEESRSPYSTGIVQVKWDNPELGRFPEDKKPYEFESFWTELSDVERIE